MQRILLLIIILLSFITVFSTEEPKGTFSLSGFIKDAENGELLPGATVYIEELKAGAASNNYGYYSISLKPGTYHVIYSFIGYTPIEKTIELNENLTVNIDLKLGVESLNEVEITAEAAVKTAKPDEKSIPEQEVNVQPLSEDEMRDLIAKAKEGQADDDCLMCGS